MEVATGFHEFLTLVIVLPGFFLPGFFLLGALLKKITSFRF